MTSYHIVEIQSSEPLATVRERFLRESPKDALSGLSSYLQGVKGGNYDAAVVVRGGAVKASGTLTLASVVATNTCVINGVTFTAIASGATGNQFNVGGSDTATAENLAAAINASASAMVNQHVRATSSGAVVTVSAKLAGVSGNAITLAGSTNITASGARLESGSDGIARTYQFGKVAE